LQFFVELDGPAGVKNVLNLRVAMQSTAWHGARQKIDEAIAALADVRLLSWRPTTRGRCGAKEVNSPDARGPSAMAGLFSSVIVVMVMMMMMVMTAIVVMVMVILS
jgi:hypothetical protein